MPLQSRLSAAVRRRAEKVRDAFCLPGPNGQAFPRLFAQLNKEQGLTIILVTHDAAIAHHAKRIIRISDGLIEGETKTDEKIISDAGGAK